MYAISSSDDEEDEEEDEDDVGVWGFCVLFGGKPEGAGVCGELGVMWGEDGR